MARREEWTSHATGGPARSEDRGEYDPGEYEAVIGLEIHAQLKTRSKIFCACSTQFGDAPNQNTCPVCLGLPGALPVLNREAVRMAAKAALALGCRINLVSVFSRKNYFYPDLPKGYQISQYDQPFSEHGEVEIDTAERDAHGRPIAWRRKRFRIRRLHIEEDAGKSLHEGMPDSDRASYIEFNRSGVPLIEIVSEPDFRSSWEAYDYMQYLRQTLQYVEVCEGNMEEGNLRCDANVSVRRRGTTALGTKVELKNLNSFRFLQRALEYEIRRQIAVLESGGQIVKETRLWDEAEGRTYVMRTKEEAHDYRYFPEPDLPPLIVTEDWIEEIRRELPELPNHRKWRFMEQYGLSIEDAATLTSTRALADYYEAVVRETGNPRASANWILSELMGLARAAGMEPFASPVTPQKLAGLIRLIADGTISGKIAKTVLEEMFRSGQSAEQIVRERGLVQITDAAQLEAVIRRVLDAHAASVAQYRAGKEKLFGFFVGQVMRETGGRANPQLVNELLRKILHEG
jgi:aspartyl-tRNA(Asn)/glutamyl-tRNA(Gln) amidotransferase subunit B